MAERKKVIQGCGDHSCVIAKPKGMGTNGGCRCPTFKLRAATLHFRIEREAAAQEVERLRAALGKIADARWNIEEFRAGSHEGIGVFRLIARRALTQEDRNGR